MKLFDNAIKPENFAEQVIWYGIICTYIFYLLGAQPLVVPAIIWFLSLYLAKKLWQQNDNTPETERINIPPLAWLWVACVAVLLPVLIIAHLDFDVSLVRLFKSLLKWSRGWAVWALLLLISSLKIRPKLVYRAITILCIQSLPAIFLSYLAFALKFPEYLLVSPLHRFGGDADFYTVFSFIRDGQHNLPRITLYSPWAPNLAMMGMVYYFVVRQEKNQKLKFIATIATVIMIVTPLSRTAIVCFPFLILLTWVLTHLAQPVIYFITGICTFLIGLFSTVILDFLEVFIARFHSLRASSSAVRIALVRISLDRWWNDAPIWGHGFTPPSGSRYTDYLPIGTSGCGTWVNLLYTKGIVGFSVIFVAIFCTFIDVLRKAQKNPIAKVGLSTMLVFLLFSFIEELDLLAYIYWPGILVIGLAIQEKVPSTLPTLSPATENNYKSV